MEFPFEQIPEGGQPGTAPEPTGLNGRYFWEFI